METLVDFAGLPPEEDREPLVRAICDAIEAAWDAGTYPQVEVDRPWSRHNPTLRGEFARPRAIRWYLERELGKLAASGAKITVDGVRERVAFDDPAHFESLDEDAWDLRQKKLFLFRAERIDLSLNRLEHYTGTPAERFQRHVLFTNYEMHAEAFRARYPGAIGPGRSVQMPAWHHELPGASGLTLVNIGVGPSNAKTITDHVAVLRPDAVLMVGHCAGLRNHQEIGDLVLATGYMRDDRILDDVLPTSVPVASNHFLNALLLEEMEARGLSYRLGTVFTTSNRNWEFNQAGALAAIRASRSVAVDMESATVAANGFRYRIPTAALLCVSDKPLHGQPKLSAEAQAFYRESRVTHLEVAAEALEKARDRFPGGLPASDIRSADEPLLGSV